MFRRTAAALFIALWLVLLGIEFSEDMGFIQYDEPEIDQRVTAALTGLGEAIKISDDLGVATSCSVFASPVADFMSLRGHEASFEFLRQRVEFVKPSMPIYRIRQAFLI